MPSWSIERKSPIILPAIIMAGFALRWIQLGRDSLWFDEVISWTCASRDFWEALYCDINKPPGYYTLLHYWMGFFGSSESALRAFSIPPGVITIWLLYLLVKKLFSHPIAYAAAAYQAVSTFQIYYSQEARNYSWLVLFLLLAGLFLWNAVESKTRKRRWQYYGAYTLAITLALYMHYFAVFFIAAHGLYILFRRPRQLLLATGAIGAGIVLIAPWLLIMVRTSGATEAQLRRYLLLKFPQAYFSFMFGDTLIPLDRQAVLHVRQTLAANWWILTLALGSVAILIPYCRLAWKRWGEPFLYVAVNATISVLLAFFVSLKKMLFDERYMIPSSPYVYALIVAGIWEIVLQSRKAEISQWRRRSGFAAVGAYCLLLLISLYNYYYVPRFGKEQWREAIAYIEVASSQDTKDLVVFEPDYIQLCYQYYQRRGLPIWPIMPATARELVNSNRTIQDRVRGFRRVWLVRSHYTSDDIRNTFRLLFPQRSYREFPKANGIEVFAFDVPPTG